MVLAASGPQRRTFSSQILTFRGRSNRANYWLTLLAISVAYSTLLMATLVVLSQSGVLLDVQPVGVVIALLNWLIFLLIYLLAAIRRLHDRDKSAHWLWLFGFAPIVLNVADILLDRGSDPAAFRLILMVPALALVIWGIIELGFFRGTVGPNRFGPDPSVRAGA